MIITERDAEKLTQAVIDLGGMTDRQLAIYWRGIADGKAIARDEATVKIAEIEIAAEKAKFDKSGV
jgi:hypothetical protein